MNKLRLNCRQEIRKARSSSAVVASVFLHGVFGILLFVFAQGSSREGRVTPKPRSMATAYFKTREQTANTHRMSEERALPAPAKPRPRFANQRAKKHAPRRENQERDQHHPIITSNASEEPTPSSAPLVAINTGSSDTAMPGLPTRNHGTMHDHEVSSSNGPGLFRPSPFLLNGNDVKIPYPERARLLMVEGIVRLRLTISETGRVIDAEILSGPAFGLRSAALIVARKLFFLPATDVYGKATIAQVDHEVIFKLNKPLI